MKRLTTEQKEEIQVFAKEGMSPQGIAESMGISLSLAKKYSKPAESDDEEVETADDDSKSIEDFYEMVIAAKDAHIASLEQVIELLTKKVQP